MSCNFKLINQQTTSIILRSMCPFRFLYSSEYHLSFPNNYEEIHAILMPYLWTIVIDVSIFFAIYKHKFYNIYIHAAAGLVIALITLISTTLILIEDGIPSKDDDNFDPLRLTIGFAVLIVVVLQVVFGIISKIMQLISWSNPVLIYMLNALHKYLGYGLTLLGKIQVFLVLDLNIQKVDLFWSLIKVQILILFIWALCKIYSLKLEAIIFPKDKKQIQKKILSRKEVKTISQHIGIFGNYVYDLKPLLLNHPNGYKIIDSVKGKELDRYLYGMHGAQRYQQVPANSHSSKVFDLLASPIAKICIPSIYTGLEDDINEVQIQSSHIISIRHDLQLHEATPHDKTIDNFAAYAPSKHKDSTYYELQQISPVSLSQIYQIRLTKKHGTFSFTGYTSLQQIGRYYSLTIDNKITRLYTALGFLQPRNVSFVQNQIRLSLKKALNLDERLISTFDDDQSTNNYISLLIKEYPNGKLSSKLAKKEFRKLQLSCVRGEGLRFPDLQPGKLIIVAGGTGLYPFSDLIDLLYKEDLAKRKPQTSYDIYKQNSLLASKMLENYRFHLFLAVNQLEEIHPITLAEMVQLCRYSDSFQLTIKLKSGSFDYPQIDNKLTLTRQRFERLVLRQLQKEEYSKLWICGPTPMTTVMSKMLEQNKIDQSTYHFI